MQSVRLIKLASITGAVMFEVVAMVMAVSTVILVMIPLRKSAEGGVVVAIAFSIVLAASALITVVIYREIERRMVLWVFMRQMPGKTVTFKQSINVSD